MTVRSTWWILILCFLLNVGMSILLAFGMKVFETQLNSERRIPHNPDGSPMMAGDLGSWSQIVTTGCSFFGVLVFMVLAILIITNEHSSKMVHSTFIASPRRVRVLLAKMIVLAVLCVIIFAASLAASWAAGYFFFLKDTIFIDVSLFTSDNYRILGGFLIAMVLLAWFSFGLGALIRSTAGSLSAGVSVLIVLPLVMQIVVNLVASGEGLTGWRHVLAVSNEFLPTKAGELISQVEPVSLVLGPWQGLGVLGAWALLSVVLGMIATGRKNA